MITTPAAPGVVPKSCAMRGSIESQMRSAAPPKKPARASRKIVVWVPGASACVSGA